MVRLCLNEVDGKSIKFNLKKSAASLVEASSQVIDALWLVMSNHQEIIFSLYS